MAAALTRVFVCVGALECSHFALYWSPVPLAGNVCVSDTEGECECECECV